MGGMVGRYNYSRARADTLIRGLIKIYDQCVNRKQNGATAEFCFREAEIFKALQRVLLFQFFVPLY
jgi:hypothetical protein